MDSANVERWPNSTLPGESARTLNHDSETPRIFAHNLSALSDSAPKVGEATAPHRAAPQGFYSCLNGAVAFHFASFGDLYRRWKARLGAPKAITAMAHKLARILWHLLKYQQPFNPEVFAKEEAKMKRKRLARLEAMATTLNYRLVPNQ